jgi:hypothetical protein
MAQIASVDRSCRGRQRISSFTNDVVCTSCLTGDQHQAFREGVDEYIAGTTRPWIVPPQLVVKRGKEDGCAHDSGDSELR